LRASLALRERGDRSEVTRNGFEHAATAFEALTRNDAPETEERGYYRVLSATCFHLADLSAVAYSLFSERSEQLNVNAAEEGLILLVLRDLARLRTHVQTWLRSEQNGDAALASMVAEGAITEDELVSSVLNLSVCRSLAFFDFALQTGNEGSVEEARGLLTLALDLAANAGMVSLWWIVRICRSLLDDLWTHSLHQLLPWEPPPGGKENYPVLRRTFLSALYGRRVSEIELWPSQREAAARAADLTDNLVVALPTSAGKTRIAELAALMTLSTDRRVVVVTPLRALSAQTERSFRRTFSPLGFAVSSLYGASGISAGDEDALRSRDIVIATPEKLDFALRADPSILDDVGLLVLDEGHMIGPTEREIRYEALVQRVLRRGDASERRIVCLSAVLPDGEQITDLTAWIRRDAEGHPVKSRWRPTRQRFGTLMWQGTAARLTYDLSPDGPFVPRFVEQVKARGRQRLPLPRETKDLTLFGAWEFARQGKGVLVFLTQANWVESYASEVVELAERGYLDSLLEHPQLIRRACEIGAEWLGEDHPAVKCLEHGVAVHHGRLPNPFLRELERLLSEGVLKVTIASPTLSQGLNLNAAVLLVPALHRAGKLIPAEEFANVSGRAGRAFVDIEGLVLHVMHRKDLWREKVWRKLAASTKTRALQSGLLQVVSAILAKLAQKGVLTRDDAFEYLANSREAWITPSDHDDTELEDDNNAPELLKEPLENLVERLDIAVFSLIEALDSDVDELPILLDEALRGSLWARQIGREGADVETAQRRVMEARAELIWNSSTALARHGHFAMGVGLETGLAIDRMATELEEQLDSADAAAARGDTMTLGNALVNLATRLLAIRPFIPDAKNSLDSGWEELLRNWVAGAGVEELGTEQIGVVEDAFTYRLVWALEALRTRRPARGLAPDKLGGAAAATVETGVPHLMMALLIRAGLPSRRAAIEAVELGNAAFEDPQGMRNWLGSDSMAQKTLSGSWPSPETAELWQRFVTEALSTGSNQWNRTNHIRRIDRSTGAKPDEGLYRMELDSLSGEAWILTADHQPLVRLQRRLQDPHPSHYTARFYAGDGRAHVERVGPGKAKWGPLPS
jgi:hypothetical protein